MNNLVKTLNKVKLFSKKEFDKLCRLRSVSWAAVSVFSPDVIPNVWIISDIYAFLSAKHYCVILISWLLCVLIKRAIR